MHLSDVSDAVTLDDHKIHCIWHNGSQKIKGVVIYWGEHVAAVVSNRIHAIDDHILA
jgi:hypothetical protein